MTPRIAAYIEELRKRDCPDGVKQQAPFHWNEMHVQARLVICSGACLSERFATETWESLEEWVQILLCEYIANRSNHSLRLCA